MNDAPAFQFFPRDWIAATRTIRAEARGAYIDLLSASWLDDGLDDDPEALQMLVGLNDKAWASAWPVLERKFPLCADGRRRNPRQEEEREKQRAYQARCAKGGQTRATRAVRVGGKFTRRQPASAPADSQLEHQPTASRDTSQSPASDQPGRAHRLVSPHQVTTSTALASTDQDQKQDQDPGLPAGIAPCGNVEKSPRGGKRRDHDRPQAHAHLALEILDSHERDDEPYRDADWKADVCQRCADLGLPYNSDSVRKSMDAAMAIRDRRAKRSA